MSSTDRGTRRAAAPATLRPARPARRLPAVAAAAATALAAPLLLAIAQVPGPIEIGPSWATADQPDHSGMLFTRITNHGSLADRLMAARCPSFGHVELTGLDPATQGDRGAERGVLLEPGATVVLSPGGPHLAATDASRDLTPDALISCVLDFAHAGERIVVFGVGAPRQPVDEP